jgi:hypothetical protein
MDIERRPRGLVLQQGNIQMKAASKLMIAGSLALAAFMSAPDFAEAGARVRFFVAPPFFEPAYPSYYAEEPIYIPRRRDRQFYYVPPAYYDPPAYYQEYDPRDREAYGFDEQYYEPQYEPPVQKPRRKQASRLAEPKVRGAVPAPAEPGATTGSTGPAKQKQASAITCDKATKVITGYGFSDVKSLDCKGQVYAFNAKRDGKTFAIKLNAKNGELTEVKKL